MSGRCVATLFRVLGDIDAAEDAVQDAVVVALTAWPRDGLARNPGAWITTTARNRAIDRVRRRQRGRTLQEAVAVADHRPRTNPDRVPDAHELPARFDPVLAVVALTFNAEGEDLRAVAIPLARALADLVPDEPEVLGLLALLLLTEARWPARRDPAGNLVLLRDQDRTRRDRALVDEGHERAAHLATDPTVERHLARRAVADT